MTWYFKAHKLQYKSITQAVNLPQCQSSGSHFSIEATQDSADQCTIEFILDWVHTSCFLKTSNPQFQCEVYAFTVHKGTVYSTVYTIWWYHLQDSSIRYWVFIDTFSYLDLAKFFNNSVNTESYDSDSPWPYSWTDRGALWNGRETKTGEAA